MVSEMGGRSGYPAGLILPGEHLQRLHDVSAIEPVFPNGFFANEFVRNVVYGGMRDSIDT